MAVPMAARTAVLVKVRPMAAPTPVDTTVARTAVPMAARTAVLVKVRPMAARTPAAMTVVLMAALTVALATRACEARVPRMVSR